MGKPLAQPDLADGGAVSFHSITPFLKSALLYHASSIWSEYPDFFGSGIGCFYNKSRKKVAAMKKSMIPGTKIMKLVAGKNSDEEKLEKDLGKIGRIELLGRALKNVFSL